jgi:hypothetical protein
LIWSSYYALPVKAKKRSFWWRDIIQLIRQYKGIASPIPQSGATINFWEDLWGDCVPKRAYPELYSFVKCKEITLQDATNIDDLDDLLQLPISAEASWQLEALLDNIDNCNLHQENDIWVYIWGGSIYNSQRAYQTMKGHREIHPSFKWLWKSCCQLEHKIFFWLILKDRINVQGMLR